MVRESRYGAMKAVSPRTTERRLSNINRGLKHARFLNADGNRKRTFRVKDRIVSQIFKLLISHGEKILSKVNVAVRGQVKTENSSLPVAFRVFKNARA